MSTIYWKYFITFIIILPLGKTVHKYVTIKHQK